MTMRGELIIVRRIKREDISSIYNINRARWYLWFSRSSTWDTVKSKVRV